MIRHLSPLEKMLLVYVTFTMSLLAVRVLYTQELSYIFYAWNTFLAILPLVFSHVLLRQHKYNIKALLLILCWLALFPNAAYLITDLFHYEEKPPMPKWYDLLLVTTAAWNGLLLGIVSLMQVEQYLLRHMRVRWVRRLVIFSFILCGYGVYIGRYLRFNSWDAVVNPQKLLQTFAGHLFLPHQHLSTWAFTLSFGAMFGIVYFTLKQFQIATIRLQVKH